MTASASSRYCIGCGAVLASDNSEAACRPCQRAAQETSQSPPVVPASFWQADQIRDALEARHMGHVVRAYRDHPFHGGRRIPQEMMARWLCVSQAQLSRIEAGRPLQDLERLIQWAALLRIPRELLWFDLPDAGDDVKRREILIMAASAAIAPITGPNRSGSISVADDRAEGHVSSLIELSALSVAPWASPIYDAALNPARTARNASREIAAEGDGDPYNLHHLDQLTGQMMQAHLISDYARLSRQLPALIGRLELASLQVSEHDYAHIQRLLSDLYSVTGWTLIKADSPAAAWVAAQSAIDIAGDLGDPLRSAAATRCLSEVHMRARNFREASRIAFLATVHLDTTRTADPTIISCLRGAALLSASAAAARRGDSHEASTAMRAAASCADDLVRDYSALGTVFGPSNVAIHRVAVAVELGDAREAIKHIPAVNLKRMPAELIERRARFLIDVARAYGKIGDDPAAIATLIDAEGIAPDEVRNHRLTRDLVRSLLTRERRTSGLRAFAERCEALD